MPSSLIGNLAVSLMMETSAFEKGASHAQRLMAKTQRSFEQLGSRMSSVGQKLSLAVTAPLLAMGATSVKAAVESKQAGGQVEAALKSMGDKAGRTSAQLEALASKQMRQSLYDDDDILRKVTANLLTFGNVATEQFDRAQQAAIDISARMGTDLQGAAIMVGKALNDPAKGLAALRRVGIQFTEQQQEQIKAMAAAGNAAGAQRVMLAELERQFGGSAKAMREADPAAAMQQSWNDFQEELGKKLLPLLPRITEAITGVLDAFGKLSPGMQTAVIAGAGLAAVFGPVLMGLGAVVSATAPFTAAIATLEGSGGVLLALKGAVIGLAAAFGPFLVPLAAVAAAGYLIYQNWDKIAPVLARVGASISAALGPATRELIAAIADALTKLWNGPAGTLVRQASALFENFAGVVLRVLGTALIATIEGAAKVLGMMFETLAARIRFVVALFDGTLAVGAARAVARMVTAIKAEIVDRLDRIWESVRAKIDTVKGWFFGLYDAVVGNSYVPDMVDGIAAHMARLDSVMVDKAKSTTEKTKAAFQKLADDLRPLLDRLIPEARELIDYRRDLATIDKGQAGGAIDAGTAGLARRRLKGLPDDPNGVTALPELEPLEPAIDKIDQALGTLKAKAQVATVAIAKSFKDMADATLASLSRLSSAIKGGGFLGILEAVIGLGLQLGSIGAFGKKVATRINAPVDGSRAIGGPVVSGRSYLVGERGPELFAPRQSGSITPNHRLGGGGRPILFDLRGAVMTEDLLRQMEAMADGAKVAGAFGGMQLARADLAKRARRRLGR